MADASSSSSSSSQRKFNVFLSFRGDDTRNNFTAHLYDALCQKGINTFIDNDELKRGEVISSALVTAIENSMFSVIVLSENYASSRWCLEELLKILECKENKGQTVLPIFYHVDPSDVRKQRGKFGEALAKHEENMKENMERVKIWRDALTQVANLSGWDTKNIKNEALLIKDVAKDIFNNLFSTLTSDTKDLVGIDSRIQEVEMLLRLEADDVRMVGIWGMGGIGKTTLAKAIYEKISDKFEGCCFLDNVANLARKGKDLKKLLLSRVLRDENIDVTTTSVKARLHSKKVLIVIDNVNHRSILRNLAGESNWFGPQSRIIITTRDKHLFVAHDVTVVYEVQKLEDEKAIELFNHYAFRNDSPSGDVMELIDHVIAYAQGLPLALEVFGSSLCKKSKDEWECALNKLQKIPNMEIQKVLQISFDELEDHQQNLFLDIAFIFWGAPKDLVIDILKSCGFFPISGIKTLVDKSLISIIDNELYIHDLLIEMGKGIVRRTSPEEPGKRSRLVMQEDICHVLENLTGTKRVEVIDLDLSGLKEIRFTTAAFAKMTKLRVLRITAPQMQCEVHISDDFKFHYDELRYLFWDYYPLKLLPSDFKSKNLVWLCMPHSHLTQLWEGNKVFENLKYMDLRHSKYLTETPDFSSVTNLNSLILDGCTQLCKIHPSLGDLDKLTWLSLENCINLEHFPGISQLVSLETLILSGCSKLEKFLDISQHMPCLRQLYLDGTAITELPSSIDYATKLEILDLKNCRKLRSLPSSICKLTLLWCLSLSGCSDLGKCEVNSGNLEALPGTLDQLCSLKMLFLQNCWSLRALPALPSSLVILNASNCESLEDISPQSVFSLCRGSIFRNCSKLTKFQSRMERDLQSMAAKVDQEKWRSTFEEQNSEVDVQFSTVFPGSGIPDWFKHRSKRWRKIDMKVSPNWYSSNFLGFALCAVVAPKNNSLTSSWSAYCDLEFCALNSKWKSSRSFHIFDAFTRGLKDITIGSDHVWLAYVPSFLGFAPEKLSHIRFSFDTNSDSCIVRHCGVCPVYIRSSRDEDCSYIDDGNPSGRDLDDFHESGEAERSSVQEDVNDSVLQDDAEPRGGDCNDGFKHLFDPQILTVSVVHGSQLICVT